MPTDQITDDTANPQDFPAISAVAASTRAGDAPLELDCRVVLPLAPWRLILIGVALILAPPVGIFAANPVWNGADLSVLIVLAIFAAAFHPREGLTMSEGHTIKVEAMPLRGQDGELSGAAKVRGFFASEGVDWVAPRRDSMEEALADVAELERHGLHRYRISYTSRGFTVRAATGETAYDIARQRWPEYGYPYAVEHLGIVALAVEHPDARAEREAVAS